MSSSAHRPRQSSSKDLPMLAAFPTLASKPGPRIPKPPPSSSTCSSSSLSPASPSLNHRSNTTTNPLNIPEILELVLLHVLLQFQNAASANRHPFASSSSSPASSASSLTTTTDIQLQIRAQKPVSTRLAFLRVCRLWYNVGEPLLWKDVKWTDYQSPQVHQRICRQWTRVRSLTFEYGMRTTDAPTDPVQASPPEGTSTSNIPTSISYWANGPRARMRNLLGSDTNAVGAQSQQATAAGGPSANGVTAATTGSGSNDRHRRMDEAGSRSYTEDGTTLSGRPRVTLEQTLAELARAMSRPSDLPHYRPKPLPLRWAHGHKQHPLPGLPSPAPRPLSFAPLLHRSQLTSLTLNGLFRLETFLEAILPFVPELTYLDICLRCYEWKDEIRLDKVLRTCPKLEYLSVDRNMIGRVDFADPSLSDEGDLNSDDDDSDDDMNYEDELRSPGQEAYAGTSWHIKYAHFPQRSMSKSDPKGCGTMAASTGEKRSQPTRRRSRQRPLALRVLKLKKVRMLERGFVRLLRLCPLLEELDVFSTIYWGWSRQFLSTVAQSCPEIRHLHLTTNYVTGGTDGIPEDPMHAGIVIFHETPLEQLDPPGMTAIDGAGEVGNASAGVMTNISTVAGTMDIQGPSSAASTIPSPYDPVIELIKLYPALLSYDARYVRFRDSTLQTLQQHCQYLERLDLTCCREVSSKAIDHFLRYVPTLKHFSASRARLRIEDMVESAERHDRYVQATSEDPSTTDSVPSKDLQPLPRWWACEGLETFIIGVQNPSAGSGRDFDYQAERAADFQFYYRDYQGQSSSSSSSRHGGGSEKAATAAAARGYDHTRYCTFVLFQQLGRLRKLKRLELHGGRFDLGIGVGSASQRSLYFKSSTPDLALALHNETKDLDVPEHHGKTESKAQRGLRKMKSFLSLGGKSKQKAEDESGKEKPNGKGKHVDRSGCGSSGDVECGVVGGGTLGLGGDLQSSGGSGVHESSGDCNSSGGSVSNKTVPSHWTGLQPLAGLAQLESFSMNWSNFPMLREQEMAWICQHWIRLEWISLGLVPDCEWDQIRNWVRSRRKDIVVVFER
ncbi:hypothetical protein BC939DRAFT_533754 [Gamsiella multidivaricata]|uniref:uncharacterized protein n=1 Tax=Gamsiella multidivaricata TaxID=101098 RepID=UPI00221F2D3D|nr:uncharacterized protein BC939DRAFT_533754 [Gamsiella multidivaricata]KAI7816213.1 hypothetical protein BC939DRAFT_533754 [Gamsiella multidivaricata]